MNVIPSDDWDWIIKLNDMFISNFGRKREYGSPLVDEDNGFTFMVLRYLKDYNDNKKYGRHETAKQLYLSYEYTIYDF